MTRIINVRTFVIRVLANCIEAKTLKVPVVVVGMLVAMSLLWIACGVPSSQPFTPEPAVGTVSTPTSTRTAEPAPTPAATPAPPTPFRLTILHNNDGESQLVNLGSGLEDFGGVARFATVVQREKLGASSGEGGAVRSGVIMVSSGDNFLAGPEFTAGRQSGTFHDALALALIGYDAIALATTTSTLVPRC